MCIQCIHWNGSNRNCRILEKKNTMKKNEFYLAQYRTVNSIHLNSYKIRNTIIILRSELHYRYNEAYVRFTKVRRLAARSKSNRNVKNNIE